MKRTAPVETTLNTADPQDRVPRYRARQPWRTCCGWPGDVVYSLDHQHGD